MDGQNMDVWHRKLSKLECGGGGGVGTRGGAIDTRDAPLMVSCVMSPILENRRRLSGFKIGETASRNDVLARKNEHWIERRANLKQAERSQVFFS